MTAIPMDMPSTYPASQDRGISQTAPVWATLRQAFPASPSVSWSLVENLYCAIDAAAEEAFTNLWDGHKAHPVEGSTLTFARIFAAALPTGVDAPEVYADRDGDISFEWHQSPRSTFSVSIRRDGVMHYAGLFGPNKYHGSEVLLRGIPESISHGIRRVKLGI